MSDAPTSRRPLPTGTVTFVRTDVEGSMRLARALGTGWDAVNATHLDILRSAIEARDGVCVRTEGDAMFAAFGEAGAAVEAAIDAQRALAAHPWAGDTAVRVRMGIHTGEAHLTGDDYGGFDVNRVARISAVGHGEQIVLSATTRSLVESRLPSGVRLRDLGRHALRDIPQPEHLFQLDIPGLRSEFPPIRVAQSTDGNLPERLTTFVGRSGELDALDALLGEHRLVTLTGPGGIGKTSLAVEAARRQERLLPDGAWFVALDDVTDPSMVTSTIARTLGLFDGVDRPAAAALPSFLADRSLLLLLDNFEHLLAAAGDVAMLVRLPRVRILVTSRAALHLSGEQEYPVRPLAVGDGASELHGEDLDAATRLFIDRARAVRPDWVAGDDLPIVIEICALLDGLPLGIELAAARMSLLSPVAIRDRLAARLPLPGSGPRDAPARQRTLERAIEWSDDLLSPDEQSTLHALAVFEGGFDVDQAERVIDPPGEGSGGDVLDRIVALAEHSLINRDQPPVGDAARLLGSGIRFGMLKTVQGYALGRLRADDREAEIRRRHAVAYLDLAEGAGGHLYSAEQPMWLDRLTLDQPNLRAALRWTIDAGETELALRLVGASWRYWQLSGRLAEGDAWVRSVMAMPGADAPTPARLLALTAAGGIAYWRSERDLALQLYREQLALAQELGDAAATADAWYNVASATYVVGDRLEAERSIREARRRFVELGDEKSVNRCDWGATNLLMDSEGPAAMREALGPILDRAVALDDAPYVVLVGGSLAWANFVLGDFEAAARWGIRSILASYGMRDMGGSTIALPVPAMVAIEYERTEDAALIMGAFDGLCERYGVRPPVGLEEMIRRTDPMVRLRAILDPATLAPLLERGRRMSLDEAMDVVVHIADSLPASEQAS